MTRAQYESILTMRHGVNVRRIKKDTTMRDKIDFPKNQPVEVVLAYAEGKEGENGNGQFYTYSTLDQRIFFATPTLNQKVQAFQPKAGDGLTITLKNVGGKNQWDVQRTAAPVAVPSLGVTLNQNGHVVAELPVKGQGETAADIAMKQAIDVCDRGQKYGTKKGMSFVFNGEDIRCIMNTIQIGMQKGAR